MGFADPRRAGPSPAEAPDDNLSAKASTREGGTSRAPTEPTPANNSEMRGSFTAAATLKDLATCRDATRPTSPIRRKQIRPRDELFGEPPKSARQRRALPKRAGPSSSSAFGRVRRDRATRASASIRPIPCCRITFCSSRRRKLSLLLRTPIPQAYQGQWIDRCQWRPRIGRCHP